MDATYWHRQQADKPLFSDLLWSRPETKLTAGKLLVIGGNVHGFASPATAFTIAAKAGAGSIRILLPDSLQKTVSKIMPEAEFAPSTPSGSFAGQALDMFLEQATWADGVLLAGDFGRNSETAILLEKFVSKSDGLITITRDGVDYFTHLTDPILHRSQTTMVLSIAQLQALAVHAHFKLAFTFDMDLIHLVEALHIFTSSHQVNIIVKHLDTILVAVGGQVSTTKTTLEQETAWRLSTAAQASVWWMQNKTTPFEALTTAVIQTLID